MLMAVIGLLVTVAWLGLGGVYITVAVGWENLFLLLPSELGQFAVGLFLPLAFLWLVLGYFHLARRLQRIESNDAPAARAPLGLPAPAQPEAPPAVAEAGASWVTPAPTPPPAAAPTPLQRPKPTPRVADVPQAPATPPPDKPAEDRFIPSSLSPAAKPDSPEELLYDSAAPVPERPEPASPPPAVSASPASPAPTVVPEPAREAPPPTHAPKPATPAPPTRPAAAPTMSAAAPPRPPVRGMAAASFAERMRRRDGDRMARGAEPVARHTATAATPPPRDKGNGGVSAAPLAYQAPPATAAPLGAPSPPPLKPAPKPEPSFRPPPGGISSAASVSFAQSLSVDAESAAPPRPTPPLETRPPTPPPPVTAPAPRHDADDEPESEEPPWRLKASSEASAAPTAAFSEAETAAATSESGPPAAAPAPPSASERKEDEEEARREPFIAMEQAPDGVAQDARREGGRTLSFRHLVRITSLELNAIAMDLTSTLCGQSEHKKCAKRYDKGEKDAFFELAQEYLASHEPAAVVARLKDRGQGDLLDSYARKFERLMEESRQVDVSGALAKSIETMAIGRLYARIKVARAS